MNKTEKTPTMQGAPTAQPAQATQSAQGTQPAQPVQQARNAHRSPRSHRRPAKLPSSRAVNAVVLIVCLIALIPMLVIGIYDRPGADDYGYSLMTLAALRDSGGNPFAVIGAAAQTSATWYFTWQGLYSSAFLMALQPGILGSQYYCIGAYLIIAFVFAASVYLAYCVEHHALRLNTKLWPAAGFLFATLVLQCMPYANEGIYWYNGAINYTPYFFATFFSVGMCITALSVEKTWQRALALVGAMLVSLFISGGNYMPAFFNIMVMVAFTGIGFMKRRFALVLPLLASVAGFAISALAPGTAIRQALLSDLYGHQSVVGTIVHSTYRALMDIRLFIDLPVVVFLLLVTPLIVAWARKTGVRFSGKVLVLAALASFVFIVGSLCVPFYAAGGFGEGRTRDAAYFVVITLITGLYGYTVCWLSTRVREFGDFTSRMAQRIGMPVVCLLAVLAVGIVSFYGSGIADNGNSALAFRSLLSGEAQQYAREFDDREAILIENSGGEATITTLKTRPKLLFFSDVIRNDDVWTDSMAKYYGLEKINLDIPDDFERYTGYYE